MLANADTVRAVAEALRAHASVPVVLDPVLASSSGTALLDIAGARGVAHEPLPQVTLLTPNIPEAAILLGTDPATSEAQMLSQAHALLAWGARAILIKGGHGVGSGSRGPLGQCAGDRPPGRGAHGRQLPRHRLRAGERRSGITGHRSTPWTLPASSPRST